MLSCLKPPNKMQFKSGINSASINSISPEDAPGLIILKK